MGFKKYFLLAIFVLFSTNLFSLTLYKNNVTASFYAEAFHGKKTSNGEIFNMYSLTCAHKALPFNTILRVTNLSNGKSVDVRVNDRGPFVLGREIDLSKAAASKLGMVKKGTTKVRLEVVKMGANTKASKQTAQKASLMMQQLGQKSNVVSLSPIKKREKGTYWDIQFGAFSSKENAKKRAKQISSKGFKNIVLQTVKSTGVTRVVIKEIKGEQMPSFEQQLRNKGITQYSVKKHN